MIIFFFKYGKWEGVWEHLFGVWLKIFLLYIYYEIVVKEIKWKVLGKLSIVFNKTFTKISKYLKINLN